MNNKTLALIVIVLLIMLGAGAFAMLNSRGTSKQLAQNGSGSVTSMPNDGTPKTLKDLLASGSSQKCTYSDNVAGSDIKGTSYISGGKVRADFTSTSDGKTTTGHTIFEGTTSYVWMDGQPSGFKMEIDPNAIKSNEGDSSTNQGIDINKSMDYECSSWNSDMSLFTPPANITFSSFGANPSGSQGSSMQGGQNLCAACDSLTGDQKTQCLAALKCN